MVFFAFEVLGRGRRGRRYFCGWFGFELVLLSFLGEGSCVVFLWIVEMVFRVVFRLACFNFSLIDGVYVFRRYIRIYFLVY